MRFKVWLIALPLAAGPLGACSSPEEVTDAVGAGSDGATASAVATGASAGASATADAAAGGARSTKVENDLYSFEYSYPEQIGRIVPLAELLDRRAARSQAELAQQAKEGRESARSNGFPYNAYESTTKWAVEGATPRWLSLRADFYTYSGGAHGIYGIQSMLWERRAEREVEPDDLFTSKADLYDAARERFCRALNRERAKRREVTLAEVENSDDEFSKCPGIDDLNIVLKTDGKVFDRVEFYAGPYVAGPYAEGDYEIPVRVDPAIRAAVKPEFRGDFGG